LAAQLGISSVPREDHAHYIKHWVDVMKKDNRAIFTAAAKAAEAARYLTAFSDKEAADAA
jgi:antirestriction protein ArdC